MIHLTPLLFWLFSVLASPSDAARTAPQLTPQLAAKIEFAAKSHRLDPKLVLALVESESRFEPNALSKAGALGLGQLMPKTARELGVINSRHPMSNLMGTCRYLRSLINEFGNLPHALAAYNAGPRHVRDAGGIPRIRETRVYVKRVLARYEELKKDALRR